jgi:hypothetical protein
MKFIPELPEIINFKKNTTLQLLATPLIVLKVLPKYSLNILLHFLEFPDKSFQTEIRNGLVPFGVLYTPC